MSVNILVVEDCDLIRKVMVKTIGLAGIPLVTMHEAANGAEALEIIGEQWVDLILADLNMPVMDGFEMIERLYADGVTRSIPVVVVSTEGSETRMHELREKGIAAYVRKPFTPEDIRDVVLYILGNPDRDDRREELTETFRNVVERFALMIGEPVDDVFGTSDMDKWVQAKLSFRGPLSGTLVIAAPKDLLREIAANVLGTDVNDPETAVFVPEALKELVNLTAGQLLTAVADAMSVHDLSVPMFAQLNKDDWRGDAGKTFAHFNVEERPVALALDMRRAAV